MLHITAPGLITIILHQKALLKSLGFFMVLVTPFPLPQARIHGTHGTSGKEFQEL